MFNLINKQYHPSQYFLYSLIVFIIGIALASWWELNWRRWELGLFALMLGFLLATIFWWRKIEFRLIGLLGLFLFLALWRFSLSIPIINESRVEYYQESTAQINATIKKVDQRVDKQILTIFVDSLAVFRKVWDEEEKATSKDVSGKILVYAQSFPEFCSGDKISLKGEIKRAESIEDFRYDRFLAKDNIYSLLYYPQIFLLAQAKPNFISLLAKFKSQLGNKLDQNLAASEASIAKAMILGDKSRISKNLRNNYSHSGISHIMAISGLHISLLTIIMLQVLIFIGLWRYQAFYLITFLLALYLVLIGFPASALRASLMAWLVLWA